MNAPRSARRAGRRTGPLVLVALGMTLFTACAAGSTSSPPPVDATPAEGGTLRVLLAAQASCLDPAVAFSTNERAIVRPIVDSLVSMDPKTGEIEPWLAESWDVNEDATEVTFHLRDDATFSDGTPVDAEAVKTTFDYLKTNLMSASFRGAGYLRNYAETRVEDEKTATIVFEAPSPQFLAGASTSTLGILSTSSAAKSADDRCGGDFTASGPFTLESYTQGQTASLAKRADYEWGPAAALHQGPAYVDGIEFQIVNVSNARAGGIQSGQADVAVEIAPTDIPQLEKAGVQIVSGVQPGMAASIMVNSARPGLTDAAMLEALRVGFDRASAVSAVLGDYFTPATSVLSPTLPQYVDQSDLLEFDADGAASALKAGGWVEGEDGVLEKDGVRADFQMNFTSTYGAYYLQLLQIYQQQMKELGITINLNDLPQADLLATIGTHDYDFYVTSLTDVDPDIVRSTTVRLLDEPSLEAAGIMDLFAATTTEADPQKRSEIYAQLQEQLIADGFVIPYWNSSLIVASGADVLNAGVDYQSFLSLYDASIQR